jgi:cytochrome b6-f complex iron-sulfur subunit
VGETIEIPRVGLGEHGVAVTRLSTTAVVAVSMECTHQGCKVALPGSPSGNPTCEWPGANLNCPCHCSSFTTTGTVVNGPATRNLKTYAARIVGSEVVVTLS